MSTALSSTPSTRQQHRPDRRSILRAISVAVSWPACALIGANNAVAQNTIRGRFNMTAFEPPVGAPAFGIETLAGGKIAVGPGQVNKFVLLNFWATWCPPCVRELPSLQQAVHKVGADRFEVFAVSVDKAQDLAKIQKFKSKFALAFPIGLDHDSQIAAVYGVNQFPSTFLVSPDGMILAAAKGERDWHTGPAISYFEELMKRHA